MTATPRRQGTTQRKTKETDISVTVDLDGTGIYDVSTGIGFLDHMLEQLSRHSTKSRKVCGNYQRCTKPVLTANESARFLRPNPSSGSGCNRSQGWDPVGRP